MDKAQPPGPVGRRRTGRRNIKEVGNVGFRGMSRISELRKLFDRQALVCLLPLKFVCLQFKRGCMALWSLADQAIVGSNHLEGVCGGVADKDWALGVIDDIADQNSHRSVGKVG